MNKLFKNSVANLSLIGLGTSFGCYQQNMNVASAKQEIYWYQKWVPYFILALFSIKCAKQVECENDMEDFKTMVDDKSKLLRAIDFSRYGKLCGQVKNLESGISIKEKEVQNATLALVQEKRKLLGVQSKISGKDGYLNSHFNIKTERIKWSLDYYANLRKQCIDALRQRWNQMEVILPKLEKLEADKNRIKKEYEELKKKLREDVRESIESVRRVVETELENNHHFQGSICEALRNKEAKDFFTKEYGYEFCSINFSVTEMLEDIINGKKVNEENNYGEFVEKILEKLCDYKRNKISEGIKPGSSNIVMVQSNNLRYDKGASFPVLFRKDSSLYKACELYIKIRRDENREYSERIPYLNKRDICKSQIIDYETRIKKLDNSVQLNKKEIRNINREKDKYLKIKNNEKTKIEENIKKLEEDIERKKVEINELKVACKEANNEKQQEEGKIKSQSEKYKEECNKITHQYKNVVKKYRNESWFVKIAEIEGSSNEICGKMYNGL